MKHTKPGRLELVLLAPQSADMAQKQATADKLKFNLLVDAHNEVGNATFPEDLNVYLTPSKPTFRHTTSKYVLIGFQSSELYQAFACPTSSKPSLRDISEAQFARGHATPLGEPYSASAVQAMLLIASPSLECESRCCKTGSRIYGPPYTKAEEDEFYRRVGRGPKRKRPSTQNSI
jgi:hypothetical protein